LQQKLVFDTLADIYQRYEKQNVWQ